MGAKSADKEADFLDVELLGSSSVEGDVRTLPIETQKGRKSKNGSHASKHHDWLHGGGKVVDKLKRRLSQNDDAVEQEPTSADNEDERPALRRSSSKDFSARVPSLFASGLFGVAVLGLGMTAGPVRILDKAL